VVAGDLVLLPGGDESHSADGGSERGAEGGIEPQDCSVEDEASLEMVAAVIEDGAAGNGADVPTKGFEGRSADQKRGLGGQAVGPHTAAVAPKSNGSASGRVHIVTEEEAAACQRDGGCGSGGCSFSLYDVVLPLPGTRVHYPAHETGRLIARLCAAVGVAIQLPATPAPAPTPSGKEVAGRGAASSRGAGRAGAAVGAQKQQMPLPSQGPNTQQHQHHQGKVPGWAFPFSFASLYGGYRRLAIRPKDFEYK
jgi:hypothetical protein